ncbi:MAG: alkaline phosphatase D family protein [Candidatus Binatia bacterium]
MKSRRKLTRREFLKRSATIAAAIPLVPCLLRSNVLAAESLQGTGLSLPCIAGDVTADGGVIWLRAERESLVAVEYSKDPAMQDTVKSAPLKISSENDYTGKVSLRDLEPRSTYHYRAIVADKKPGPVARFVTAPRADQAVDLRFAFSGDTRHRYQPFTIMDAIREKKPEFFLHLGDTIYGDLEGAARNLSQFREKYVNNRKDEPTRRLFSETSLFVVWDDHEVADNYRAANPLAPVGRRAFMDYWPVRQDPADGQRIYRSVRWGSAAELFILDTRQYRDESAGTILGAPQKEWFLDGLANSNALFKFVCTSVPFSSPAADKWGGYPADRDEVLKVIKQKRIDGVIFLAADVHYAAAVRVPGNSALREVIAGPLAAQLGRATGTAKRFEYFNNEYLNYGLVNVSAESTRPYVEIEILTDKNTLLHKIRIDGKDS